VISETKRFPPGNPWNDISRGRLTRFSSRNGKATTKDADMSKPVVSVIIPVRNSGATIKDATDSVEAQTLRNCEVIVVDDASCDDTPDVIRSIFSGRGEYRLVFLSENKGPAAARNRGIREAGGEWIAFLDADDAWLPGRLEWQIQLAAENPDVAMWCGDTVPFDDGEEDLTGRSQRTQRWREEDGGRTMDFWRILLEEFVSGNPVATSTVLVKKAAVEWVGGFDEQFRGPEDYDLWMRIAGKYTVGYIKRPLARYRSVAGSLSMDDRKFLPQVLRVLDKAFAEGGALYALRQQRRQAVSNQFWNASWMAFSRGDRATAVRYWIKAYALHCLSRYRVSRRWFPLLLRYLFGKVC
jgi:glycosyltransferase involved in cell wall biosynthesis